MATRKPAKPPSKKQPDPSEGSATRPDLGEVRARIDGIDRSIQALIAEGGLYAKLYGHLQH